MALELPDSIPDGVSGFDLNKKILLGNVTYDRIDVTEYVRLTNSTVKGW